jgi:glutathione S-transferase
MIKIHGTPESRAYRSLWCLRELGLAYEHVPTPFKGARTDESLLAINPNGRVPALLDGEVAVFESMAINLYLVRKYGEGTPLALRSLEDEALALSWSFWVMTEIEYALLDVLMHGYSLPEASRDAAKLEAGLTKLKRPMAVLDATLASKPYLHGDHFGIADLNVSAVLGWGKLARLDFGPWPHVRAWLDGCVKRDAALAARKG